MIPQILPVNRISINQEEYDSAATLFNHPYGKTQDAMFELQLIRFEFNHFSARYVSIAGSFNNWNSTAKIMRYDGNGFWFSEIKLLPGVYEYCLVVDGFWKLDPLAADYIPNRFGGGNSVLLVNQAKLLNSNFNQTLRKHSPKTLV
jgi:1,4-alpha-glucan branching enzyme